MTPRVRASARRGARAFLTALGLTLGADTARAQPPAVVPDRVAVRFFAPETGGAARPRFLTERELGLAARIEALVEQIPVEGDAYPERALRAATDRLVARTMLATLLIERGTDPPDLPRLVFEARTELADRVGGAAALEDAMRREGIEEHELLAFVRDQVRAMWYVDKAITPILAVTEDSLREAYRSNLHPFRAQKYEDVRGRLRAWVMAERMRAAELEFLQSARARIKIASLRHERAR